MPFHGSGNVCTDYPYSPMFSLESFKIDLKGLETGVTTFQYDLGDAYFSAVGGSEVGGGNVHVRLDVRRSSVHYELDFSISGTVTVACDLCLDDMEQPVEAQRHIVAKFGDECSEDENLVIVDENEGVLDVAWLIYEFIALAVPVRHVHAPGKCNPVMIKALEEHSAARSSEEDGVKAVDPRWSELEKLKTIIKD